MHHLCSRAFFAALAGSIVGLSVGVAAADPPRIDWTPDRRPVYTVPLRNGQLGAYGLSPVWYQNDDDPCYEPDETERNLARDSLISTLDAGYEAGWRRFMLNLPAGGCSPLWSGNQWTALRPWKKHIFNTAVKDWIEDPAHADATIGVYSGAVSSSEPNSLCAVSNADCGSCAHCAEPGVTYIRFDDEGSGRYVLDANALPWISNGFKEMFLDTMGATPADMHDIFVAFYDPFLMKMGGEAIPVTGSPAVPDPSWIDHNPWTMTTWFATQILGGYLDVNSTTFDLDETEVGVIFSADRLFTGENVNPGAEFTVSLADMHAAIQHGWVPWSGPDYGYLTQKHRNELLKRIYSFGTIQNVADFNCDGIVNSTDLSAMQAAYFAHLGVNGNFVHGNINGDNIINPDDLSDFITIYYLYVNFSVATPVDLGGPEPESAALP